MGERFRPAGEDEVGAVAALVNHSFPSPARGRGWWEEFLRNGRFGGWEALWVGEENGAIVAACQLLPLRQWVAGVELPVMGLGAVTIAPTHRRRGLAGRLITAGFAHARTRGDVASALYPFRVSYYAGLGYGLAGEAVQYQIPPQSLADAPEQRRRMRLVTTEADRRALRAVYDAALPQQTGQLTRGDRVWQEVLEGEDRVAVLYQGESGQAEGYAVARYRADLPVAERFLEVEERLWLTPEAQRGIYAWLASLGDQWREILYRAHPDECFAEHLSEPRLPTGAAPGWGLWFPSATLLRGPMFRLLDVPEALARRPVASGVELSLVLEVEDTHVPGNHGRWRVHLQRGKMLVEGQGSAAADATLTLPVGTLSRLFIGALTPTEAVAAQAARITHPELLPTLDAAFRVPRPWTFDRF